MKLVPAIIFSLFVASFCFGQDRQTYLDQLIALKKTAATIEDLVLAPSEADIEAAARENANAARIVPRETYDNNFSSIRGGGSFYSFYYRMPDYGYGSEIYLERDSILTGGSYFGVMANLGEVSLSAVSRDSRGVTGLANYSKTKLEDIRPDFDLASRDALVLDETTYSRRLKPVIGNTYVLRSINFDYYDILVAFRILRQDSDKSLILLWRLIEQYDTPRLHYPRKAALTDSELLAKTKRWQKDERYKDVQISVNENVTTLSGSVDKKSLPYLIQMAHLDGAAKVINLLSLR